MKKKKGFSIQINFSNRWLYTFIVIGILSIIGVGVYAYGTSDPVSFGHTPSEIDPGTFAGGGDYVFPSGSMVKISDAPVASDDVVTKEYVDALGGGTFCYWDYSGSCATGFTSLKTATYRACYSYRFSTSGGYGFAYSLPPGATDCGVYAEYSVGTAALCCK